MFAKVTFAHNAIYSEKCTVMDPLEGCAEILDFIFSEGCSKDSQFPYTCRFVFKNSKSIISLNNNSDFLLPNSVIYFVAMKCVGS